MSDWIVLVILLCLIGGWGMYQLYWIPMRELKEESREWNNRMRADVSRTMEEHRQFIEDEDAL